MTLTRTERNRKRREKQKLRRKANMAAADVNPWNQFTPYHWWRSVSGQRLDWWPSTRKAQWQGKVYTHIVDIDGFIAAITTKPTI